MVDFSSKSERKRKLPWLIASLLFFILGTGGYIYLTEFNGSSEVAIWLTLFLPASLFIAIAMLFTKNTPRTTEEQIYMRISKVGFVVSLIALIGSILSTINFYFFKGSLSQNDFAFMGNGYPVIPALFATWYFLKSMKEEQIETLVNKVSAFIKD